MKPRCEVRAALDSIDQPKTSFQELEKFIIENWQNRKEMKTIEQ